MKNYFVYLIFISLTVFLLYTPLIGDPKVVTFEKNLSIDPSKPVSLEFRDDDGSLRFSSWEKDIIEIKVRKETKIRNAKKADRLLNATKIKISQKNNEIKIKIQYPKIKGIFFWIRDYRRIKVSTEIMLPYRSNIKCILDDGSINGDTLNGRVFAETDDGTIRLSDIQDSVKARTDDGRIILKNIEGEANVEADDGDIELSGKFSSLNISTDNGDVEVSIAPNSVMDKDWQLITDDGDVELFLSDDFSSEIDIRTDDGNITTHIPLTLKEISGKNKISGRINEGGLLLSVKTDDGNVILRKL